MTAPRVLLDATPIPANRAGVGRYVDGVVAALAKTDLDLIVVAKPADVPLFEQAGVRAVAAPAAVRSTPVRMLWEQFGLARLARKLDRTVIHTIHYTFPLLTRLRRVVSAHDLTFFTLPEVHTRIKAPYFRWWLRRIARTKSVGVIAISQATAGEFTRITGIDPARITVSHLGYDPEVFHPPTADEVRALTERLGTDRWIAFLGTLEPRKNVVSLIRAHTELENPPPLLLAGSMGWDHEVPGALEAARAAGSDVRTLGYLAVDELRAFLGGSQLVAYPSLGEGFGLPVIEAMASGATLLTTPILSLPEVGGDAVAYTDPDVDSLRAALVRLLADPAERARLAAAGPVRATGFTWEATARGHRAAYDAAAGS